MGYTTEFDGEFCIDKPIDKKTFNLLEGLRQTRRMKRQGLSKEYGIDGEFYIDGEGFKGQEPNDESIVDHNEPPSTQPSLWLQWEVLEDHKTIMWDGGEKFYCYVEWIEYIVSKILKPRGYTVNGSVEWMGEDRTDLGIIEIENNVITVRYGTVIYE